MGTGGSKYPDWYPGEPDPAFYSFKGGCSCGRKKLSSSDAPDGGVRFPAPSLANINRQIELLPVVELTDWKFIAKGAFCSVHECKYKGFSVVAKRVKRVAGSNDRREALNALWNEYECLRKLRHPNIIDVYGMCRIKREDEDKPWGELDVCLVVERLAIGTLGDLLATSYSAKKNSNKSKKKMISMRSRLNRVLELALALEYVHGGSGLGTMMHRDLKSENVGFAQDGRLKLIDFGLSKMVPGLDAREADTYEMTGGVGSIRYMAPELVYQEPYNSKADIYSWAILSWEILAVSQPYSDLNEPAFMRRVVMDGERPPLKKTWPENIRNLLTSAWDPDLQKRPCASKIVGIIRSELAQEDRLPPDSRTSASSAESRICDCEHSLNTPPDINAPDTLSHGSRGHGSRKRFLRSRSRNPSTKRRSSIFGKKRPGPPARDGDGVSSAANVGALEGVARPAVRRLEGWDPAAGRAMSLTYTMMRNGSVFVEGQGRERGYIRQRSVSHGDLETPEEDGDYDENAQRVEHPVGVLGGVGCPLHHDLLRNRDKIVAMFSQEREGVVKEEPLSRGRDVEPARVGQERINRVLEYDYPVVENDQADMAALDIQGGDVQRLQPQLPMENVNAVVGDQMRQVRPGVREDAAGDACASRVTRNEASAPIGDLGGRSQSALDDVSDVGQLLRVERENGHSLDAQDFRHQLTVTAGPLTNSRVGSNMLQDQGRIERHSVLTKKPRGVHHAGFRSPAN